jgi:UDP-3-O-[3-hydroxymyristoyl] glucosamine N-acyltransferase
MTGHRIRDIAAALGAEALGAADFVVTGVAEPAAAGADDLALAMSARYAADLAKGRAKAAVLGPGMDWQALGLEAAIIAPRPRYAMATVTRAMDPGPRHRAGHPPHRRHRPDRQYRRSAPRSVPSSISGPGVEIGRTRASRRMSASPKVPRSATTP